MTSRWVLGGWVVVTGLLGVGIAEVMTTVVPYHLVWGGVVCEPTTAEVAECVGYVPLGLFVALMMASAGTGYLASALGLGGGT